jgi:protoporphyrinogen oxidase
MARDGKNVVVMGGGPAGLTAAYMLAKVCIRSVVLEKEKVVGGLSKTIQYDGYRFDIGGHRFFTRVKAVQEMWREVLPDGDFLRRKRLSRIYYNNKFFYYPLRLSNTLSGLGFWNSALILISYLRAQLRFKKRDDTFEDWITNRFGKRLYRTFFKSYTEKVWGMPCDEITAEWAAQRIKGLSLVSAVKNAVLARFTKHKSEVINTLADEFYYPRQGPGMMWEAVARIVQEQYGRVSLDAHIESILWSGNKVEAVEISRGSEIERIGGTDFISSIPVSELIAKMKPAAPASVLKAAASLNYRDFLLVVLIVNRPSVFPDNWIYIHDPKVKIGRIQNFKNWSAEMVPDREKTCLGLEYFCFEGDSLWAMSDDDLVELGKRELHQLGLVCASEVEGGLVVRTQKAYPVYDSTYREALRAIRGFVDGIDNLQLVGRNGMHKYNNQDHSMLTAMLAVENILGASHDLWEVNADQKYLEGTSQSEVGSQAAVEIARLASTQPRVPTLIEKRTPQS